MYLTIRFEYKLAIPALLTVIHDVWLSISIYSFTGREVTSATVAALLTILGYSLYDVVIVFDRIRENEGKLKDKKFDRVINISINETLSRTLLVMMEERLKARDEQPKPAGEAPAEQHAAADKPAEGSA